MFLRREVPKYILDKQVNGGAEAGRRLTKCVAIDRLYHGAWRHDSEWGGRDLPALDRGAEGYTVDQRGGQMGERREGWIGE